MRIGYNPNKNQLIEKFEGVHQVIIPVFIPNLTGYFRDSLKIFELSVQSLRLTSSKGTFITVVSNGCCDEVVKYINELYFQRIIQDVLHLKTPGKLNAILKGLVGQKFKFITITDADVLFENNWQDATYEIFKTFKKVGVVCPTPSSKSYNTNTGNILFEMLFSKKLQFSKVQNPLAMINFAESIGDKCFYNSNQLDQYLTLSKNGVKAVVGAGHFSGTYRGDIFKTIETLYTPYKLGGSSESKILDLWVVKCGFWRLSTSNNYARHMGNTYEQWMDEEFEKLTVNNNFMDDITLKDVKFKTFRFVIFKIMNKLMTYRWFKNIFLKHKGLNKKYLGNY